MLASRKRRDKVRDDALCGHRYHAAGLLAEGTNLKEGPMRQQDVPGGTNNPYRVLLVEEDVEIARPLHAYLTHAKLDCRFASDAATGWLAFEQVKPHIALLSLGLPNLGGIVLCPKIRAQSAIPVVTISIRKRKEDHLHALKLGADDFIVRPVDDDLLLARISTLLRRVYEYDATTGQAEPQLIPEAVATPQLQSTIPRDWITCDSCEYMGPSRRFDRLNTRGERAMLCPHCEQAQTLTFNLR